MTREDVSSRSYSASLDLHRDPDGIIPGGLVCVDDDNADPPPAWVGGVLQAGTLAAQRMIRIGRRPGLVLKTLSGLP